MCKDQYSVLLQGKKACNKDINTGIFTFEELWFSCKNKHAHRKLDINTYEIANINNYNQMH